MKEKVLTIILAALFVLAVLLSASCGGDGCCYSDIPGCCATVTAIPVFLNAPGR